jgi:pre-mRNA-processing factor 6
LGRSEYSAKVGALYSHFYSLLMYFITALEQIPNSVRLWKETVNLETSAADARVILARAVEVIPQSVELWLALARLETPEKAKGVLNKARKAVPTSHEIWIAAGRLIEQEAIREDKSPEDRAKELGTIDRTIEAAVRALRQHQVLLTREQWLKEAERCEMEGSPRTCEAIVKATIAIDVEEEDRLDIWVGDAEAAEERGMIGTTRAILAYALKVFPDKRDLWWKAALLEKERGTKSVSHRGRASIYRSPIYRESLEAILERAVQHCPQAENLWLMWAKERWLTNDVTGARGVLEKAFVANPESEQIWLAAVKLEAENGEIDAARELLIRARTVADTDRVSDHHYTCIETID